MASSKIPGLTLNEPPVPQLPLASLDPSNSKTGEITAVVTLIWPYSTSAKKLTALLAEEDHRKRENRGTLKVTFLGHAAEKLRQISIGDRFKISVDGAKWSELEGSSSTDVPWMLTWERKLNVKVRLSGPYTRLLNDIGTN